MQSNWLCSFLLISCLACNSGAHHEEIPSSVPKPGLEYTKLQEGLGRGWNTWNTRSVLSHVYLPDCMAVDIQLYQGSDRDTLREALIGREDYGSKEKVIPGLHAYDGSYTDLEISWKGIRARVQSAASGKQFCLLIEPLQSAKGDQIFLHPQMLWGNTGEIKMEDAAIEFKSNGETVRLFVKEGKGTADTSNIVFSAASSIALSSDSTGSYNAIKKKIADARTRLQNQQSRFKDIADVYEPVQSVMAWNTIYDAGNKRVITPISRNWNVGWKGWILFDWDTYFGAYMLSLDNKELAYANAIAITHEITDSGFIPNFSSSVCKSEDRSEPPVGAFMVNEIFRKYQEKWFIREVFDDLLSWNRWWDRKRNVDGYLCWGSDPYVPGKIPAFLLKGIGKKKGAQWESGLDNSPMWDDATFDSTRHVLMQADVGLMSFYILDCRSLAEIATALGKDSEAKELQARADQYAGKLATLWDEQSGIYLNKDLITGAFSHRLSPTLFYPLLAKVPDQAKAARMMKEHYFNPKEFAGDYILPSISRNDPAFKDNKYWRGRIWAPMNFLVYMGMRNYQLPEARKDLVDKSKKLLLQSWKQGKYVFENYNAETGAGDDAGMSDAFYHWGALLGFISIIDKDYVPSPKM